MNLFVPPPPTPFNFLSLGAGVQSSTMALMAAHGEITPTPNAAIFADTQAEPASVYRWLEWLTEEIWRCPHPFPVHVVTKGSLTKASLTLRHSKSQPGKTWSKSLVPAFIANPDGTKGIMSRACTFDYKIVQIDKMVRNLAGIKRAQKEVTITQWIGISWDELQRMKNARNPFTQHRWPLIEMRVTRRKCLEWMKAKGYPAPPRSACVYCPFHSDSEWRRLRDEEPEAFQAAVQFDKDLREIKSRCNNLAGKPYLHASLKPLDEVDFSTDTQRGQGVFDFQVECEGMCGV